MGEIGNQLWNISWMKIWLLSIKESISKKSKSLFDTDGSKCFQIFKHFKIYTIWVLKMIETFFKITIKHTLNKNNQLFF